MNNKLFFLALVSLTFLTISCEDDLTPVPLENLIVVRGYLYAGQPVNDVILASTLALDDESESPLPLDSAEVILKRGTESFVLKPVYSYDTTETDTIFGITYAYPDSDLVVAEGDTFTLEINYDGQQLSAETIVPAQPDSFTTNLDTLYVPNFDRNRDYIRWIFADSNIVRLNWDNSNDEYHYLLMDNVEEDPQPLEKTLPPRWRRFISQPFIDTTYTMFASTITHFGRHDIVLFHVQEDYVLLYQSSGQDSRDLNEPFSNINGGLGMFTAFNSDTVSIVLLPEE
ncbi:MAG: DUF4249 family protein [Candidatus Marinimicrobia bacterium]|jgi:hypothetical protein|nr:DUF4249 family protein [Candidatus Neomarinimicrobiota bacterium]MBT4271655.1 DUF4249 family protein [Candidatus Neomarinimicrobiota bacterium]MBT4372230.1 DUF4249 family protein [Candidatus Neomarinimicrobiota bacterium]MBT6130293.1 DUF4249 family protein [Candidatus Neomarinimicrobiota bacterium]MBT6417776.1 DUF4249 family protein [Candidatus Neomarinimicrobiota bacterium]